MLLRVEPGAPRPRIWLYAGLSALVVALIALALLAEPAYDRFKLWRALQLSEAAGQALRANDLPLAKQKAQVALQLYPRDARVLRQAAIVNALLDPTHAVPLWYGTWRLSHDPADLREVVLAALAANEISFAADQFKILQAADPKNPLTWLTEARLDLALYKWPEALAAAQRVLKSNNVPDDAHFVYVQATQLSSEPEIKAEGIQHLRLLATRSDELGLRALRDLADYPGNDPFQIQALAQSLQDHPLADRNDKLLALALRGRLPGADDQALENDARELFPPNDPGSLVTLGHWLMSQGKYPAVLELIDNQTAFQRQDLFLIRLDAMAKLKQWAAIKDVLDQPDPPIPEELRLLFEARTLTELGEGPRADLAWDQVRLAVANEPIKLANVAAYAAKLGLDDIARSAYQSLINDLDQRRGAFEQWVALERREQHTEALHQVLAQMAQYYPSDPVVRNDVLYTGFLLNPPTEAELDSARQQVQLYPSILSYRITLALGYLQAGQPAAAMNVFAGLPINWSLVSPSWRAVFATVLRANGLEDDAKALRQLTPTDQLLPEEVGLLNLPPPVAAPSNH
ncbi:MAG: hypothetical protein ABSH19_07680 [Opitutales bacterium]|jgi:hypothetical protein